MELSGQSGKLSPCFARTSRRREYDRDSNLVVAGLLGYSCELERNSLMMYGQIARW